LGGQKGLNLALELHEAGVLEECGTELLGTPLEAIQKAEDRELFRESMLAIGEPVPESQVIHSWEEAKEVAQRLGYPLVARPAFTLGGTGGGVAWNEEELKEIIPGPP